MQLRGERSTAAPRRLVFFVADLVRRVGLQDLLDLNELCRDVQTYVHRDRCDSCSHVRQTRHPADDVDQIGLQTRRVDPADVRRGDRNWISVSIRQTPVNQMAGHTFARLRVDLIFDRCERPLRDPRLLQFVRRRVERLEELLQFPLRHRPICSRQPNANPGDLWNYERQRVTVINKSGRCNRLAHVFFLGRKETTATSSNTQGVSVLLHGCGRKHKRVTDPIGVLEQPSAAAFHNVGIGGLRRMDHKLGGTIVSYDEFPGRRRHPGDARHLQRNLTFSGNHRCHRRELHFGHRPRGRVVAVGRNQGDSDST